MGAAGALITVSHSETVIDHALYIPAILGEYERFFLSVVSQHISIMIPNGSHWIRPVMAHCGGMPLCEQSYTLSSGLQSRVQIFYAL